MYCGDETGAFIGDVGSHTARFGYGGDDCPTLVVPSAVYSRPSNENGSSNYSHRTGRAKYSAPVSVMRMPPDDCISANGKSGEGVGFIPIYQSLNSNNEKKYPSGNDTDDGVIQDFDAWASLWEYSFQALCVRGKGKHTMGHKYLSEPELQPEAALSSSQSQTIPSESKMDGPIDHPLLAVDSTSRTVHPKLQEKQRALMLETLFESLSAPAAYIAPSPMLSSFAYGRQTSLVIDVGHSGSRVTPLVDGYCLSNGSVSSGRGGRWLGNIQKSVLEGVWDVNGTIVNNWNGWGDASGDSGRPPCREGGIIPRYLLHPTSPEKCSGNKLEIMKQSSFHSMAIHEVMYEMMTSSHIRTLESSEEESVPFCGYGDKDEESTRLDNDVDMEVDKKEDEDDDDEGSCYVLPDGTKVDLAHSRAGKDLCRLPELLYSETLPSFIQPTTNDNNNYSGNMLPLQQLIHKSLTQILDVNLRKELSSNIILTGGASLFPTLDKRLSIELGKVLPSSYKYKVIASKNSVENRYSAWIGGSILSSLGSFQQLWLSKKEYEECGSVLGLQRFKN
mmetsp:Transcript_32900/g.69226  ORF Transcript_32900/g.69226 Transcript_32900/m.69226 type:complete len:560 (+) Transcript_32900:149-1828(+)|eukprot:CAMPEP_0172322296 /NCGR_PEP_ID=MMETSP1058-20130122/45531_1 /TAXON_ID=83371 /ORGANISM="Detonula confervacea, Strain CCMP 353" /LENGTH=559 /DNA_ID=CAMNT_0013038011 /DNA_START=81 /DNA_END=1760 /DNA_ORIENTATION=-